MSDLHNIEIPNRPQIHNFFHLLFTVRLRWCIEGPILYFVHKFTFQSWCCSLSVSVCAADLASSFFFLVFGRGVVCVAQNRPLFLSSRMIRNSLHAIGRDVFAEDYLHLPVCYIMSRFVTVPYAVFCVKS